MTAEQIAAGLTRAQREVLVEARQTGDGRWLVRSGVLDPADKTVSYHSLASDRLTPLGLAVRKILEGDTP